MFPNNPTPKMPEIRPLYNIPNIISSDRIIWVEGEKCADALNQMGFTATVIWVGRGCYLKIQLLTTIFRPSMAKKLLYGLTSDKSGKRVAELVKQYSPVQANAKSVTMLSYQSKPE